MSQSITPMARRIPDLASGAALLLLLVACQPAPDALVGSWPGYRALPPVATGVHPNTLVLADWDGDGDTDIVVPALLDPSITLLENLGPGRFQRSVVEPWPAGALDAVAADLDRDGRVEILATTFSDNRVFALAGAPWPTDVTLVAEVGVAGEPSCLAAADLVGDDHLDVLVTRGQAGDAVLLEGHGAAGFSVRGSIALARRPSAVLAHDIDGDGALEIAAVASIANRLVILEPGPGVPGYAISAEASVSGWPASLAAADLDGDGQPELVGATNLGDTVFVARYTPALAEGDVASLSVEEIPAGAGAFGVALADLDGDGAPDAAVTSKFADTVILYQNRDGTLEPVAEYPTGSGPTPVEAADLDSDGIPDLVVVNGFSNDITIYLSSPE